MVEMTVEMTAETHRQFVEAYVIARRKYEELQANADAANAAYREAYGKLAVFMQEGGLKTLKYDDLGAVTLKEPTVRPNILKENQDKLFEYVRSIGREDVIKANIHPSTLGALIRGLLAEGQALPEFVGYYLEPSLMYRAGATQNG